MNENLLVGLELMVLGMGFVLSFLCIMVGAMYLMSAFVKYLNKIFPEELEIVEKKSKKISSSDEELIAVALAAAVSKR